MRRENLGWPLLLTALGAGAPAAGAAAGAPAAPGGGEAFGPAAPVHAEVLERLAELEATVLDLRARAAAPRRLAAAPSYAAAAELEDLQVGVMGLWLVVTGALVLFMQAGFSLLHAGSARAKNAQDALLKVLLGAAFGAVLFFTHGWALAFGGPYKAAVGNRTASLPPGGEKEFLVFGIEDTVGQGLIGRRSSDVDPFESLEPSVDIPRWFFHMAVSLLPTSIASGAFLERTRVVGHIVFVVFFTGVVYPIVAGSTWGRGWLNNVEELVGAVGFTDLAGGGVVMLTGGTAALVGSAIHGARKGRWENPEAFQPHSVPHVVLGTFILWLGWYGLCAGSLRNLDGSGRFGREQGLLAAQVATNVSLAAGAGGLAAAALRWLRAGRYEVPGLCQGILAGLVSITAGAGNMMSGWALLVGAVGGLLCECTALLTSRVGLDDPINAGAVFGPPAAWGVLAAVLFDWGRGIGWSDEGARHYHGPSFTCIQASPTACAEALWPTAVAANGLLVGFVVVFVAVACVLVLAFLKGLGLLLVAGNLQDFSIDEGTYAPWRAYDFGGVVGPATGASKGLAAAAAAARRGRGGDGLRSYVVAI